MPVWQYFLCRERTCYQPALPFSAAPEFQNGLILNILEENHEQK
jgi:hypothetical protein